MGYDQSFFVQLKGLISDPASDLRFERPQLDFEALGLKPSYCHLNVQRWIDLHPGWRRVRGWLVSPYAFGLFFAAHSLAAGPHSELWDVTPYLDDRMRDFASTFVKHPGPDNQFDRGVNEHWGHEGVWEDPALVSHALGGLHEVEPWLANENDPWSDAV